MSRRALLCTQRLTASLDLVTTRVALQCILYVDFITNRQLYMLNLQHIELKIALYSAMRQIYTLKHKY